MSMETKLRADLDALTKKRDAILAVSVPLREERDAHVQEARAIEDELNAAIRKSEDGLFEIQKDIGLLAKALGGRSVTASAA